MAPEKDADIDADVCVAARERKKLERRKWRRSIRLDLRFNLVATQRLSDENWRSYEKTSLEMKIRFFQNSLARFLDVVGS